MAALTIEVLQASDERGLSDDAQQVVVNIIALGGAGAVAAVFHAVRERVGSHGHVEIDPPLEEGQEPVSTESVVDADFWAETTEPDDPDYLRGTATGRD
jgi:hypothetical protein